MSKNPDYYRILGIDADASEAEIKAAYRRLAQYYHPDHNPGPDAAERFREIAEAYSVLGDAAERARYDASLRPERAARFRHGLHLGLNLGILDLSIRLGPQGSGASERQRNRRRTGR